MDRPLKQLYVHRCQVSMLQADQLLHSVQRPCTAMPCYQIAPAIDLSVTRPTAGTKENNEKRIISAPSFQHIELLLSFNVIIYFKNNNRPFNIKTFAAWIFKFKPVQHSCCKITLGRIPDTFIYRLSTPNQHM